MLRDSKVYLEDIAQAITKIFTYTSKLTLKKFAKDPKTIDAVVRNLEIIGEAVKKLPHDIRSKHPDVDWKKIAGLRDILAHEYFGIDVEGGGPEPQPGGMKTLSKTDTKNGLDNRGHYS